VRRGAHPFGPVVHSAGCMPPYRPATADEPHATVKIRRIYEKLAGMRLNERVGVEGHVAITESTATHIAFYNRPCPAPSPEQARALAEQD
jgi:hypothetical protein